ncbi:hypothetical protein V5O48_014002 [Marasmius crinis-equi]|uniref:Uncharacterized protein n=1 Tax=Marasmius crinis-equi TaxID=585013 RepID=A0ABR3EYI7_9AGAR
MGSSICILNHNHNPRSTRRSTSVTANKLKNRLGQVKMSTAMKSQSLTEVTLSTVEGHAIKRRRVDYLQRYNSEASLNQNQNTRALAPAPTLTSIMSKSSTTTIANANNNNIQTESQLSLARRSPSPVPTELDVDNAERPDIDAHLYNVHKIKVIDYACCPPAKNFATSPSSSTDLASTSSSTPTPATQTTRIPEAFFAKDAIAQYEWFMARGSREWDHLSQQGTEVWEDKEDKNEMTKTEEDIKQSQSQQTPTQRREQTQNTTSPSPRRGQPLRRQERVPLTGIGIKLFTETAQTPQATNTPPTSSAAPEENQKTPLLPCFSPQNPLAPRTITPKRTAPIPGRLLYRLREIQWVTDEEARQRWLAVDWEEYFGYERREREKYGAGERAGGDDWDWWTGRGYKGQGEVGYPYWVVWGSPPVAKKKEEKEVEKEKEKEVSVPEPEPEAESEADEDILPMQVDVAEEDVAESQSIHATLSGTLESPEPEEREQGQKEEAPSIPVSASSPSPPVDESQSMHPTLSGTIKTPRNSPPPPASSTSTPVKSTSNLPPTSTNTILPSALPTTNSSPPKQASPKKSISAALAAQLYYLALAEDAQLGFGKAPSREYRRALGERAGDVWIWLGEYLKRWGTGRVAGLGSTTGKKEESRALYEGADGAGDANGSGRVLGMNAGTLGRGAARTLGGGTGGGGGLGRTATLRDLGRAGTLDATAFGQQQQRTKTPQLAKPQTKEEDAKMDVDLAPAPALATTAPPATPEAKDDSTDADMDINPEPAPQPIAGPSNVRRTARRTQIPHPTEEGQGRVTRSAAQRQRGDTRVNPIAIPVSKKRTRAAATKAAGKKGKGRAVEPELEADVEMGVDVDVDYESGAKATASKRNKNGKGKKRTIDTVDSVALTPDSDATGEGSEAQGKKRPRGSRKRRG